SLPCQKPPWGRLSAVDTETGELVWQQALGVTESLPAGRQNTGRPGRAGALVTASNLLFIAATDDNRFRALEASSGRQLWETGLAGRGNANPMTFLGRDGRQYLMIAATDRLVAFRLPEALL
ncbi:MAG: PQQ-binding-like beta-propeller repeat protein, partial [Gammaproteobacteria bacterium]|nr:PQQ-binding-like beta-propeller repeat protein [Gammaproteobacteria bacterium]